MRIAILALATLALGPAPAAAQSWRASYPEVSNPVFAEMREAYVAADLFASTLQPLNEHFPVPRTVTMELAECGEAHSYYDPERPAIVICYEFLLALVEGAPEEERDALVAGASTYVILHQVGHALVDLLRLPVRQPPEQAADHFTAMIVGATGAPAQNTLPGVMMLHERQMPVDPGGALTDTRVRELACLIYGSDPELYAWAVELEEVPAGLASACEQEAERVRDHWLQMLEAALRG